MTKKSNSTNKCKNCGSIDSKTFWDFEDDTMLCDECHEEYGDDWQKEIEHNKKHAHKNTKEENELKPKRNIWIIVILVVLLLISYSDNSDKQSKIDDAIDCLDDCESKRWRCSITTSAGYTNADLLEDNEELQNCLDDFSSCVKDCKRTLEYE